MIPKKIHYVWVGGGEKSEAIKKCMATWKNHLNGYEITEWNEKNFDIESNPFLKAAYKAKKWAYVSDFIRAKVIYEYGGIYLDTNVLLFDNFDDFWNLLKCQEKKHWRSDFWPKWNLRPYVLFLGYFHAV